ncbi:MAG: hypothetical protein LQ343_005884 [Gyalolechia ehrenbergii]|nr:MAG: hypothetical protein LQ343_005884 [Gyalolechia ehrenbergii]
MGNSDSKLVFKQGIFRLSEPKPIPKDDIYWTGFWKLPDSTEDVFSLFSPSDIRRARDSSLHNIETLLASLISRLVALSHLPAFPDPELAPAKEALNCVRVITRILPFLYESDHLESWEDKFFWQRRRRKLDNGPNRKPEVLFDGSNSDDPKVEEKLEESFEYMKPLGEEVIDHLVDLLFYSNFTIPRVERSKKKVTYAIWQNGVGCNTPMQSSKEMESNRSEILRLLLTMSSKSLYMPAHIVPIKGVKTLTYIATCPDKQIVLSILCSQLNTALQYNPSTWRVPYDHVVYKDPKQVHVSYCLQFLLVLLLYPIPEDGGESISKNFFRHFLGRLHRPQDFDFLTEGMLKTLNQPLQATSSYLPGSQKSVKWAPEMLMLFWEALQCNRRFRSFIIESERGTEFAVLVLYYALEYKMDPAKQGVVRMCVFILQTLSTEPDFGKSLNRAFIGQETLPLSVRIPDFTGTYADYLIISIHALITTTKGKLDAIYPALLATINNVAPYLQNLDERSSTKIIQLFALMSAPSFLLANDTNHSLLQSLLEAMNAIIEHQYQNNPVFVHAIFHSRKRFEALRSFTLESGQQEIERRNQRRKASAEGIDDFRSPSRSLRNGSFDNVRSPQSTRTPSLSNVPEEGGTFTIGDDEDSDEDDEREPMVTPSHSSPSNQASQSPSRSSSIDEPLPTQLRGMSEKARGKMPANQSAFSRQSSSTSLNSHFSAAIMSPTTGFSPSAHWIDSWLPTLPLHTILTLLASSSLGSVDVPPELPPQIDPSPPRVHLFSWTPLALGWYESLLWGFIFTSEMVLQKGTAGVWNGTNIRLFRVEQMAASGPSLMKPMGAVDAVGSNLVQRIGRMGVRADTAPPGGSVRDGGMQWVGYAELASAVSNAGGLGILTALTQPTPEALRTEIRKCRSLTPNPFAVNLTLLPALDPPDYHAYASVILSEGIRIVETAGNSPGPVIQQLKRENCTIIHKCTTIRHAQSAINLGVDFLSIDGFECAGHVGESDITNFILLSKARQSLKVPFIASGGFADGQGLAAALSLGAEGINMGTRFMCTVEAPIHIKVKEAIVEAQETDTELVLRRWRNTSRLFGNKVAKEAVKVERESQSGKFEDVAPYVSGKRGREVFLNGDVDYGVWTAGQVIGLIHDIPTCQDLVERVEREAEETLIKANSLITSSSSDAWPEPSRKASDPSSAGKAGPETPGTVDKNVNNPSAEIWGVGKPKL